MIHTFPFFRRNISLFLLVQAFLLHPWSLMSQEYQDFGFARDYFQPPVVNNTQPLPLAWLGGMNSCQFGTIDLDFDGVKDLLVFDRIGNRLLPFLNQGATGTTNLVFAPQYAADFPPLKNWVILKDYNMDGKEDIFTYGFGGIQVFKNTSSGGSLSFELITNQLLSLMFNSYLNIFVTDVDYPGLEDLDGDGDLDILTFWIIGTYVHYHRNMSMEKYGHSDSLDFRLESGCWGYIREGDTSNVITLNASCPFLSPPLPALDMAMEDRGTEHIGSTFLLLDLNADGLQDLLLGDVDYPQIIALYNGGSVDTARIITQDDYFPVYDTSINLFSFPAAFYLDVDNDDKKDLLVSPFDPNTLISESDQSVWLYKNEGETNNPLFRFQGRDFIQEGMIDVGTGAYPVVVDFDQDGLQDLIIGNYGYYDSSYYQSGFLKSVFRSRLLALRNAGTAQLPQFEYFDEDYAAVSRLNITNAFPAFGDLDGDGDLDMLLGHQDGQLSFFENTAGQGNPFEFAPPQHYYQGIDVGLASTPQLFDLNKDGRLDLIIGCKDGFFRYYENTGTPQLPVFTHVTDSLGKVDVRDVNLSYEGYSTPCFFRTADDSTRLFAGSFLGGLFYYKHIDGNLGGVFEQLSGNYLFLKDGGRSSFAVHDFDDDGRLDLIMGILNGGLAYFKGVQPPPIGFDEIFSGGQDLRCTLYPNPANGSFRVDLQHPAGGQTVRLWQQARYEVADLQGNIVYAGNVSGFPASLQLPLAAGMYFFRLCLQGPGKLSPLKPVKLLIAR